MSYAKQPTNYMALIWLYNVIQCHEVKCHELNLNDIYDVMHVHYSNFYVKMYHYKAQPLERWDFDVTFKCH